MAVSILKGDCRDILKTLPDQSVHCCVTSPPYFGLRDYGTAKWDGGDPDCDHIEVQPQAREGRETPGGRGGSFPQTERAYKSLCGKCGAARIDSQIGLEATPDAFVAEMVAVFREVRRVLRDDGTLFLNLGDSYMSSGARQTGRNDTSRETPGGKGGSFRGGVRRVIPCDTSGKEPEGSPANDCLCGNLCGACRAAYRLGKSHSDGPHDSKPAVSSSASSREHTGSPSDRLPTSGLIHPDDHSGVAIRGSGHSPSHEDVQPLASQASTHRQSLLRRPAMPHQSDQLSECQLCGCSLPDSVLASARMADCTCDTTGGGSAVRKIGKDVSGSAYPDCTTASLKPKDLIGIPWRVAFALQADGWYLRQDIIWSKSNPMPESVTDRCTKAHEYIFLLSKSARYFYDAKAILEPMAAASASRLAQDVDSQAGSGRVPGKTNGPMKAVSRAKGNAKTFRGGGAYTGGQSFDNSIQVDRESHGNVLNETGLRNRRSVWSIATQPFSEAHFATFPPDLIEPCIKAGCPVSGTVLDPFGGAGTTGLVADRLGRNATLIELNPEYATLAERRIRNDAGLFAQMEVVA